MYHPWRHLRALSLWDLVWCDLPVGVLGLTDFAAGRVTLDPRQTQAERRSTIAHELAHIERGPTLADPWWQAREELHVDRIAAGRLITTHALAEALAWSCDPHEVADELWVDVPTLMARLRHLTDAEVHYLRRRLAHLNEEE